MKCIFGFLTAVLLTASVGPSHAQVQLTGIDQALYFHSQVRDKAECSLKPEAGGKIVFPADVGNPAINCPDAFAWQSILQTIKAEFWRNWANDETVWVVDPKPLCNGETTTDCCFTKPNATPSVGYIDANGIKVRPSIIGAPGQYCPYIPADYNGQAELTFAGGKPQTSHNTTFLRTLDPARIERQREVEVVYRNKPFVLYTTQHELYSQAGLSKLFKKVAGEAANSAPYRPTRQGVSYPIDAIMFKADWINKETMEGQIQYPNAPPILRRRTSLGVL